MVEPESKCVHITSQNQVRVGSELKMADIVGRPWSDDEIKAWL